MRSNAPAAPWTPSAPHAPNKLGMAPSTAEAGCSYGLQHEGTDPSAQIQVGTGSPEEGGQAACASPGWVRGSAGTSRMTAQICLTHWMMVSGTPETVTARSVELGSRSPATCTCAPVLWGWQREMLGSLSHSPRPGSQHLTPRLSPPEPPGTFAGPAS